MKNNLDAIADAILNEAGQAADKKNQVSVPGAHPMGPATALRFYRSSSEPSFASQVPEEIKGMNRNQVSKAVQDLIKEIDKQGGPSYVTQVRMLQLMWRQEQVSNEKAAVKADPEAIDRRYRGMQQELKERFAFDEDRKARIGGTTTQPVSGPGAFANQVPSHIRAMTDTEQIMAEHRRIDQAAAARGDQSLNYQDLKQHMYLRWQMNQILCQKGYCLEGQQQEIEARYQQQLGDLNRQFNIPQVAPQTAVPSGPRP
ncbi:MAG: hypothetical protein R3F23_02180 [Verrucomicrobiia bacterium]